MRTYKFNRTAHKSLWTWLAVQYANGNFVSSKTWPGWKDNGGKYTAANDCFACSYDNSYNYSPCSKCPLVGGCNSISSRIAMARLKRKPRVAAKWALKMAYAKVRSGVQCK